MPVWQREPCFKGRIHNLCWAASTVVTSGNYRLMAHLPSFHQIIFKDITISWPDWEWMKWDNKRATTNKCPVLAMWWDNGERWEKEVKSQHKQTHVIAISLKERSPTMHLTSLQCHSELRQHLTLHTSAWSYITESSFCYPATSYPQRNPLILYLGKSKQKPKL